MPVLWTFWCYLSTDGEDVIRAAYEQENRKVQAKFLSRLKGLAGLPFEEWNDNLHKALHGECAGVSEVRFFADNVQQRPLGFRSGDSEFTLLIWAKEKGGKFVPRSACATALARKTEVLESRERTVALWLALE